MQQTNPKKSNIFIDYSEVIKSIKEKFSIHHTDLAIMLDVSYSSLYRWENKLCQPPLEIKKELIRLLKKRTIAVEDIKNNLTKNRINNIDNEQISHSSHHKKKKSKINTNFSKRKVLVLLFKLK